MALIAGLTLVISGCAGGGSAGSSRSSGVGEAVSGGSSDAGVDPVLVRNFRILRRPLHPGDLLPAQGSGRLPPLVARRRAAMGLLPALARRAIVPGTKIEEWLEPGRHGFCLEVGERNFDGTPNLGGFGTLCGPVRLRLTASVGGGAFLAAGPALGPGAPRNPALATGIVPDRVSAVVRITGSGVTSKLALAEGFFATRLAAGDRLYAVIAGRRRPIDAPVPGGGVPVGSRGP